MTGNAIKPSVACPTKRLLDGLEQRRVSHGIMKRWARRVQRPGLFFSDEEADWAVATIELLDDPKASNDEGVGNAAIGMEPAQASSP